MAYWKRSGLDPQMMPIGFPCAAFSQDTPYGWLVGSSSGHSPLRDVGELNNLEDKPQDVS